MGLSMVTNVLSSVERPTQHIQIPIEPAQISSGRIPSAEPVRMIGGNAFQVAQVLQQREVRLPNLWIDPAYLPEYVSMHIRNDFGTSMRNRLMQLQFSTDALLSMMDTGISDPAEATYGLPTSLFRDPFELMYLKNNLIPIKGVVCDRMADDVSFMSQRIVAAMKRTGVYKPVHFQINSPGGDITSMMSILEDMNKIKRAKVAGKPIEVATYCSGVAGSAASFMLANGSPGRRFIGPYSEYMIHQPNGCAGGRATDIDINTKLLERYKEWGVKFYLNEGRCKIPEAELRKILEEDTFMDPEEALAGGFVDAITDSYAEGQFKEFDIAELLQEEEERAEKAKK